jgi:predicted sugar kinase
MLPALVERDLDAFGEAVYDFNRLVGELFEPSQGGPYAHPHLEKLVRAVRYANVKGVGQTSWGPTIFAVVKENQALGLCDWLTRKYHVRQEEITVTSARNHGPELSTEY